LKLASYYKFFQKIKPKKIKLIIQSNFFRYVGHTKRRQRKSFNRNNHTPLNQITQKWFNSICTMGKVQKNYKLKKFRGKKNSGETMRSLVKDKTVSWEADFTFKGTLFREKDGVSYKKKFITFYVHEVNFLKF
jgi:hypothetical protein